MAKFIDEIQTDELYYIKSPIVRFDTLVEATEYQKFYNGQIMYIDEFKSYYVISNTAVENNPPFTLVLSELYAYLLNTVRNKFTEETDVDYEYNSSDKGVSFNKKTFGRYNNATVISAIANEPNIAQVLGGSENTGSLLDYPDRDSVAMYLSNVGVAPVLNSNVSNFTNTSVTLPDVDLSNVKKGMLVDVTNGDEKYIGLVTDISGQTVYVDGFYTDETTTSTPPNNSNVIINNITKIWCLNSNLYLNSNVSHGTNIELAIQNTSDNTDDITGIDIVNMANSSRYGLRVRALTKPFQEAISVENYIIGLQFMGYGANNAIVFIKTDSPGSPITSQINNYGKNSSAYFSVESNTNIGQYLGTFYTYTSAITQTLPDVLEGRVITIISRSGGVILNKGNAQTILCKNSFADSIDCSIAGGTNKRVVTLLSDGASWYVLYDSEGTY